MAGHNASPGATDQGERGSTRVLTLSTLAFTLMFAAWMMFGVLGVPIRDEFGLSDVELSWVTAVAIRARSSASWA